MGIPVIELLKSIPDFFGLHVNEQPKYEIIDHENGFEIRHYAPYRVAKTFVPGPYRQAMNKGFRRLAGYIFGGNKKRIRMEMTAPVLQDDGKSETMPMTAPVFQQNSGNGWTMTFIMPEKYSLRDLPAPNDLHIELDEEPEHMMAVLRFSGTVTEDIIAEKKQELMDWLQERGRYATLGQPFTAQYDPPFTISFLKRNEVMVKLAIPAPRRTLH